MIERPSFIVTGASASGKTTLMKEAQDVGYRYLPTHTTRQKRPNEQDGIDGIFLSRDDFEDNFSGGAYLEPSLDYAELKSLGIYYGTPTSWINELREPNNCATPVAIKMARIVLTLTNTTWIHLVCNDSDRYRRLVNRGYTDKEIEARMTSGESVNSPPREAITFNTSEIRPDEIIRRIKERE